MWEQVEGAVDELDLEHWRVSVRREQHRDRDGQGKGTAACAPWLHASCGARARCARATPRNPLGLPSARDTAIWSVTCLRRDIHIDACLNLGAGGGAGRRGEMRGMSTHLPLERTEAAVHPASETQHPPYLEAHYSTRSTLAQTGRCPRYSRCVKSRVTLAMYSPTRPPTAATPDATSTRDVEARTRGPTGLGSRGGEILRGAPRIGFHPGRRNPGRAWHRQRHVHELLPCTRRAALHRAHGALRGLAHLICCLLDLVSGALGDLARAVLLPGRCPGRCARRAPPAQARPLHACAAACFVKRAARGGEAT